MLAHMKLGLKLNSKKSVLFPGQRTSFIGVVWDSTMMQAHLCPACAESIRTAIKDIRIGQEL